MTRKGEVMKPRSKAARAGITASFLLTTIAFSAGTAMASSVGAHGGVAGSPHASKVLVSTNCHWHYDGNVYWAHCYPTDGPYTFRMHIWCNVLGYSYPMWSNWARSPDQVYSDGVNCGPGAGAAQSEWVDTSG
jgi:hypothetical protein